MIVIDDGNDGIWLMVWNIFLVGGDWNMTGLFFHDYWECHQFWGNLESWIWFTFNNMFLASHQ